MKYHILSDIGNKRKQNEDFCGYEIIEHDGQKIGVFAIADGMGGHKKGEVASKLAVENILYFMKKNLINVNFDNYIEVKYILRQAYKYVNAIVYKTSLYEEEFKGMGTTLTTAIIYKKDLYIANIGDSRCYLFTNGDIKKVTKDNSLVQELIDEGAITETEALAHPQRNVITRAIGTDEFIKIDFYKEILEKDNKIILATDGLTSSVTIEDMNNILINNNDLEECCSKMIDMAKQNGSKDNISVICITI
ncbi:Stp1/IreP family PP2C-type Ser/Thr phosphatase [Tepidibacter mesophilus]|uniref:Stp1/IreP family PP2C-type Ser/Thr phosphatase n=1 Tax=Tepidibacter mesophilus TaxID=655607 RepID=UPI000C08B1F4|nr:Stp1/IreP family PP2C-type Ser/Thr phosphatase [Tepidibacter mesophilus]